MVTLIPLYLISYAINGLNMLVCHRRLHKKREIINFCPCTVFARLEKMSSEDIDIYINNWRNVNLNRLFKISVITGNQKLIISLMSLR